MKIGRWMACYNGGFVTGIFAREDVSNVAKRTKSALKANRQNIIRREHNRQLRSKLPDMQRARQTATHTTPTPTWLLHARTPGPIRQCS